MRMVKHAGALGCLVGLGWAGTTARGAALAPAPSAVYLYVHVAASPDPGSGNWRFRVDPDSGAPKLVETTPDDGSWELVGGRGGRFAYALTRSPRALTLRTYRVDPDTGRVSPVAHTLVREHGDIGPARVLAHPTADVVYLLTRADLQALPVDSGTGAPATTRTPHVFVGATATAAALSADGQRLFVYRRGRSVSLRSYELGHDRASISAPAELELGCLGLRAARRNGHVVYALTHAPNPGHDDTHTLRAYRVAADGQRMRAEGVAVPARFASLFADPLGRFLYLSYEAVPRYDGGPKLRVVRLDRAARILDEAGLEQGWDGPSNVAFESTGRFAYALRPVRHDGAPQTTELMAYRVDPGTGVLTALPGSPFWSAGPVALMGNVSLIEVPGRRGRPQR